MSIAELWMGAEYSEYAFEDRFKHRVPYSVTTDVQAKRPTHVARAAGIGERTCASFAWFMDEVININ